MVYFNKYGHKPYKIILVHGGPGAPGTMAPVALEISKYYGAIESLHYNDTIEGQINELKVIIDSNCEFPVILIGHSYGAWLSYIFASKYPDLVNKVIFIGSGSFESEYLSSMNNIRKNRLTAEENVRVGYLFKHLNNSDCLNKKTILKEFGELMSKADSFCPISIENDAIDFLPNVFNNCMKEINELRNNKELLNYGQNIKCKVLGIHGEYDSHSYEGVCVPLNKVLKDFKFILLNDCGHSPWNETYAKDLFYEIIYNELKVN